VCAEACFDSLRWNAAKPVRIEVEPGATTEDAREALAEVLDYSVSLVAQSDNIDPNHLRMNGTDDVKSWWSLRTQSTKCWFCETPPSPGITYSQKMSRNVKSTTYGSVSMQRRHTTWEEGVAAIPICSKCAQRLKKDKLVRIALLACSALAFFELVSVMPKPIRPQTGGASLLYLALALFLGRLCATIGSKAYAAIVQPGARTKREIGNHLIVKAHERDGWHLGVPARGGFFRSILGLLRWVAGIKE
jgi:hypothetical protein